MPNDKLKEALIKRAVPTQSQRDYSDELSKVLGITTPSRYLKSIDVYGDTVPVQVPGDFRKETTNVIGPPEAARSVEALLKLVPGLRGITNTVTVGNSPDSIARIDLQNKLFGPRNNEGIPEKGRAPYIDPYTEFPRLNLLGLTNTETRNITINPRLGQGSLPDFLNTLGHEFSHAAGLNDDRAYPLGAKYANQIEK